MDGLTYLGLGVGFFIAMGFGARTAGQLYKYVSDFKDRSRVLTNS